MSFTVKEKDTEAEPPLLLAVMVYDVGEDGLAGKVPETAQVVLLIVTPAIAGLSEQLVAAPPEFVGLTLNDELTVFT